MALKLQLKRNEEPFESKEAAIEGLGAALANGNAGEIMIATYKQEAPYMYEIPLYDTDGGDTYIDWFNENFDDLMNHGFSLEMNFEGNLRTQEMLLTEDETLLGHIYECGNYIPYVWPYGLEHEDSMSESGGSPILVKAVSNIGYYYQEVHIESTFEYQNREPNQIDFRYYRDTASSLSSLGFLKIFSSYEDVTESSIPDMIKHFKLNVKPIYLISSTDLYKDEFNYSDIQLE